MKQIPVASTVEGLYHIPKVRIRLSPEKPLLENKKYLLKSIHKLRTYILNLETALSSKDILKHWVFVIFDFRKIKVKLVKNLEEKVDLCFKYFIKCLQNLLNKFLHIVIYCRYDNFCNFAFCMPIKFYHIWDIFQFLVLSCYDIYKHLIDLFEAIHKLLCLQFRYSIYRDFDFEGILTFFVWNKSTFPFTFFWNTDFKARIVIRLILSDEHLHLEFLAFVFVEGVFYMDLST